MTRRSRYPQPGNPARSGPEDVSAENPDPAGQTWELVRIAYESHFEFARHYSSLMLQARVAITTVMVLAVAFGFGILPSGESASIEFAAVPARGLVAYVAALLINLLHAMEVTYVLRFYRIVNSGRRIETEYGVPLYFSGYTRSDSWPLYIAYVGGILLLVSLFIGAAWVPRQGFVRSAVLMVVAALPAAVFLRSYVRLVRAGRTLFESSS